MYNRPINYSLQWGASGTPIKPSVEKIRNGWSGGEKPLVQHMNWILNRIDGAIGYFLQGMSRWGDEVDYSENDLINFNGIMYRCKLANRNISPLNTNYWENSYFSNGEGESLKEEIRKIKEVDGYLPKYLKISAPSTTYRYVGGSYQATSGMPSDFAYNKGFSFDTQPTTGMYLNGSNLNFTIGSVIKLTIPVATPELSDRSVNVATTDWVQRLIDQKIGNIDTSSGRLPIGSVFLTTNEQTPESLLGYGSWVRFAEGRAIVGKSVVAGNAPFTYQTFNEFGEANVALSEANTPPHRHYGIRLTPPNASGDLSATNIVAINRHRTQSDYNGYIMGGTPSSTQADAGLTSYPVGGNASTSLAHNNIQPSVVVNMWRRTA